MSLQTDHLTREQLRDLLESAVALLPASSRRRFVETIPAPPLPPPPSEEALARINEAAETLQGFLEDHELEVEAWMGDDWNQSDTFDEEHYALQADLDDALEEGVRWLARQAPTPELAAQLDEALEAVEALMAWELDSMGVPYGDMDTAPEHLEPFRIWAWLVSSRDTGAARIAEHLVARWPRPVGQSLLTAALGTERSSQVHGALEAMAGQGNDGAARWFLLASPDDMAALDRYAHLSPDIGERWSRKMAEDGHWDEIVQGSDRGISIPHDVLYQAAVEAKQYDLAFRDVFGPSARVPLSKVWDDAIAAGELDLLRRVARTSTQRAARWIGLDEPDLLQLPAKYDHDATKALVSYATARASRGSLRSEAHSYTLDEALLARLTTAPGPHDPGRCVEAALTGLEQMMAFHIAARSRSRYARAAAYWRQHGALCRAFELPARHAALRSLFVAELHRLPALRSELDGAGVRWK
ncbi:MAG: hypothetical protein ABIO70_11870 [Pseudomonadota bacterium]